MTELTDHAKTILRAIADGKEVEWLDSNNNLWHEATPTKALEIIRLTAVSERAPLIRIKPETRSINGVKFAAPTSIRCPIVHTFSQQQLAALCEFKWVMQDSRDTAYQAIVDALEGKSK